ncbi:MAG: RDD family protein [Niabella sp.]
MDFDYRKVMSEQTDEELIKIVTVDRDRYQPSATETAKEEIKNRKIDARIFEQIKETVETQEAEKLKFESKKVSSLTRALHFIIDTTVWQIIVFILTTSLKFDNSIIQSLATSLIWIASFIGYYYIMEAKYQKTFAKFITKTKVVTSNGEKPTNGDILRRTLCRLIPLDCISYFFTKNGFHDRLSETALIKENR